MEKHKITKYYSSSKNKDGKEYKTRDGKPFVRVAIKTNLTPDGVWVSSNAFNDDDPILKMKEGDEVVLKVWQQGEFWNFKIPSRLDTIEERLARVESLVLGKDEVESEERNDEPQPNDLPF